MTSERSSDTPGTAAHTNEKFVGWTTSADMLSHCSSQHKMHPKALSAAAVDIIDELVGPRELALYNASNYSFPEVRQEHDDKPHLRYDL